MVILTNKNNPVLKANFKNCFPTSLSGLTFTTQNTDTEQLTATVTFVYDIYEFESFINIPSRQGVLKQY